ncbi:helix-turn-helix domain-containing protein [Streptomyces sp. NPDC059957]|uniref:helix-turn-helix domain-containing protein n=1 Tax=unclassified Streptomyces TaxID=2593676 RepID=UPI003645F745
MTFPQVTDVTPSSSSPANCRSAGSAWSSWTRASTPPPPVGRMFFQILGAIAEFEHALMSERTMDGLEAARARGRTGGQKPKLGTRQIKLAREMYDSGDYTVQQIADEFGVTRPTIYRHLGKALPQQAANTP